MTAKKCMPMPFKMSTQIKKQNTRKSNKRIKNDIWRQTQHKDVQHKWSSHRCSKNLMFLRTEMLILHVCWKISLKSRQICFMELKILFISSFHQVWTKISFLIVFDSALSSEVGILMLMARARIDVVDFIIISETKSNGLGIYTK